MSEPEKSTLEIDEVSFLYTIDAAFSTLSAGKGRWREWRNLFISMALFDRESD